MSSIDELMKDRGPGEIKICWAGGSAYHWFQPFYRIAGYWNGIDSVQGSWNYSVGQDNWELYIEPSKKIIRYKWVYFSELSDGWKETQLFYSDEEFEQEKLFHNPDIKKLEYTATEFEE